jgi:uroporphyrinogen decarboxylase
MLDRLGQDLLSLSISNSSALDESTGYRYFSIAQIKQARIADRVCLAAVIDGAFQRVFRETGLVNILARWHRGRSAFAQEYRKACVEVTDLLRRCLDLSVAAVVIADDLAGERSPIIRPEDISGFFLPFYTRVVSEIHEANATALFHSCGNIRALIPMTVLSGFDGLAAIQDRTNDLVSIKEEYRALSIAFSGIDGEILAAPKNTASELDAFGERIRALGASGRFVLGSSCGLYSGDFLERIQELYRLVDATGSPVLG